MGLFGSEMGIVNTLAFMAVGLAASKTSQFIWATFNAHYYKARLASLHESYSMSNFINLLPQKGIFQV